jgi:hypothetical protein
MNVRWVSALPTSSEVLNTSVKWVKALLSLGYTQAYGVSFLLPRQLPLPEIGSGCSLTSSP